MNKKKIGIIICDRYRRCAGGKCFRSMRNKEGAFAIYKDMDVELVGYSTCAGCPGVNIEYVGQELLKNKVDVIHLATGMVVGYPPCPYIDEFKSFLEERNNVEVVIGTHPIPENYVETHSKLGTWESEDWKRRIAPTMCEPAMRKAYD